MEARNKKETAKFCGNIMVRKTRRRSFLAKSMFQGVFGVLTEVAFEYYNSSAQWTKGEKPDFAIEVTDIQSVEEVDDSAFSQELCFQIAYHSRTKKDNSNCRTVYLSAYEVEEFESWLCSLRLSCLENPVSLTQYHSGRFTGKSWSCCKAVTFRNSPGCKPCKIYGIPDIKRHKLSLAIAFSGFGVVASESHYSDMPGSLPFNKGDHLTVSDASGSVEWKAFSTTSTSGYGYIPKDAVNPKELHEEPWFFEEIPTSVTAAILRDQVAGCFILRTSGLGSKIILSFRTDKTVKHIEVLQDEATQKYRVKDESDAVSYANFLQFDSIQQLLDQCKQHPTLGITLEKYPTLKNADEIWRVDWPEVEKTGEVVSSLPWNVFTGKFHNKEALIHVLPEGSSDILKEKFSNQSRLMMTLGHENMVRLHGIGVKGPRSFMVHENMQNGDLSEYLKRNSSILESNHTELGNILNHVINGMVYLHESLVEHGELVPENCLVGEKGQVKISGFHCARSPWCKRPLSDDVYKNRIPITAPECSQSIQTFPADVWAYGFFIYAVVTVGKQPITTLDQVLKFNPSNDSLDQLAGFVDKIKLCLQRDPNARPTFQDLRDQVSLKTGSSTPSCSTHSLEDSLNAQTLTEDGFPSYPTKTMTRMTKESNAEESMEDDNVAMDWDNSDITVTYSRDELRRRLKDAELTALKAKALQKRAEAVKDTILEQVAEAEAKCLKEVEMMTKTFLMRLNEANDRAAEAEQAQYLAEEVRRLTEEKYTLYKYESEKNMHELKSMFDDALLERDELIVALKTVGKDFDTAEWISPKRRDSIRQLEEKYQRYISTSDRTIQSLKTQLNGVVKQRDQLASDREVIRNEMKDTREALEQAVKDKEEFQFRLEESQFEIERLEEMISTMTQKRQQAERERDQLQMLTDMSLMKLRHAESGGPKKRASVSSFPPKIDELPKEKREPSLRRLSEQLLHLIGPSPTEKLSTSVVSENRESAVPILKDPSSSKSREDGNKKTKQEITNRRLNAVKLPFLEKVNETIENNHETEPFNQFVLAEEIDTDEREYGHVSPMKSSKTVISADLDIIQKDNQMDNSIDSGSQTRNDARQFTIPTLHIEEADTDSEMESQREPPEIEISDVDEHDLLEQRDEGDDLMNPDSPMFIVGGENGETRIVYSFDDLSELLEGIPQTSL